MRFSAGWDNYLRTSGNSWGICFSLAEDSCLHFSGYLWSSLTLNPYLGSALGFFSSRLLMANLTAFAPMCTSATAPTSSMTSDWRRRFALRRASSAAPLRSHYDIPAVIASSIAHWPHRTLLRCKTRLHGQSEIPSPALRPLSINLRLDLHVHVSIQTSTRDTRSFAYFRIRVSKTVSKYTTIYLRLFYS